MADIKSACEQYLFHTYARLPVTFVRGEGCRLWDDQDREYLDFVAGIAVCNLGHCHPQITEAICAQAATLVHVSNLFYTEPQVRLAQQLVKHSFADKVFFANSGAEANEAAIKLARKYSRDRFGPGRHHIISMKRSFHGRTLTTLSATGQEKIHKGFQPLVDGFSYVEFNSLPAVAEAVTEQTCAVMVEPVQGEGGVRFARPGYLAELKEFCRQRDLLLIFDEVQVGMGRTGTLFAYQQEGVTPDIMTLAKALANGLPIGAMLATDAVAEAFGPGTHASTFGGTPLVTRAALDTVAIISQPEFLQRVRDIGATFLEQLRQLAGQHAIVKDVRGRGLMLAMELNTDVPHAVSACLEQGVLINCIQDRILRFVPPLVVEKAEIDRLIEVLDVVLGRTETA